jgi:hypothetical protein
MKLIVESFMNTLQTLWIEISFDKVWGWRKES